MKLAARNALRGLDPRAATSALVAGVSARRQAAPGDEPWRHLAADRADFLSEVLAVGVRETAEDEWTITFGPLTLSTHSLAL